MFQHFLILDWRTQIKNFCSIPILVSHIHTFSSNFYLHNLKVLWNILFSRQNKSCVLFSVFNFTSSPVHGAGSDKILFSAPDDESERRQHLLNIPRLRQFHIPSLLSLPGKTKTQGPRTAMIKVNGNLAPASIKYLDKKRSHNYCHDHCDIFLHVVTNDSHTSLWVDLHTRLELNIK